MAKNTIIIDLFCGTGAFSRGFENCTKAQYRTALGIDLLPTSVETFRRNHSNAVGLSGDIRRVRRKDVSELLKLGRDEIDLIVGGPPCQGFSSIRPFRSDAEDDPRNSLFEEFAGFVNWFRPKAFVLENVVGLATHNNGSTIDAMLSCFKTLAYDCDWKILNAAHFGVPQKRERLILIGLQKGAVLRFPTPTHYSNGDTIGYRDRSRLLRPDNPNPVQGGLYDKLAPSLPPAITVMDAIGDLPQIASGESAETYDQPPRTEYQVARRKTTAKLSLHNSTKHREKMLKIIRHAGKNISSIPDGLITSGFSSCYSRLAADEPSVTITVNFVHPASNRCIHPTLDRALTPREGARLQSFDDDFEFVGNRSQITKQIGNAVPPLLGTAIAESLADVIS